MRTSSVFYVKVRTIFRPCIFKSSILAVLSMILLMASVCSAADVTLAWEPNAEPEVVGYHVYYVGEDRGFFIDVGNRSEVILAGLVPGITYYFAVTAYTNDGYESYFSEQIIYTVPGASVSSSGSGSGGGGCFIATAAYGSSLSPEVETLREFRDRVLLTCSLGKCFVEWYYRVSPPVAAFIAGHESLKMAVRLGLTPLVCAMKHPSSILLVVFAPLVVFVLSKRTWRK